MGHYKAVQMFTVRDHVKDVASLKDAFAKISAIGYDAVQGWLIKSLEVEEYAKILSDYGLKECSVGGSFDSDPDQIAKKAKALGVTEVGISTISQELASTADGFRQFAKQMNDFGKRLFEAGGLSVNYHNHAVEFASFGGINGMDILFDETDPRYVHFTLDTHWVACGGQTPAKWIRRAAGRMPLVHFKDYAINPGDFDRIEGVSKRFAEVGQGNIEWEDVVKACKEINIAFYIVEQDECPASPFDSLKTSFDKLVALGL
jgi:sugar phosphate isomerase/epimerase